MAPPTFPLSIRTAQVLPALRVWRRLSISPRSLADGVLNQPYATVFFTATGGVAPYTWSVAPGSQLPLGLSFSSDGKFSGTPFYPATYGFVLRMTDGGGRVVDWPYSITINRF